jgi:hypothetical protein
MKIKDLNTTVKWETIRSNFEALNIKLPFPSYNILIKHEDTIIEKLSGLRDYTYTQDQYFANSIEYKKPKYFSEESKNRIESQYTFHFIKNYKIYKEKFNKLGFFKKLKFIIDYNNTDEVDYEYDLEYPELENIDNSLLFNKIYRSNDHLSIKLLINKKYFQDQNIDSLLIISDLPDVNKQLKNILAKDINQQWLDVNEENSLLTVPFIENTIVEITENIDVKILPLNYVQTQIYNFLKQQEKEKDINSMFLEFFSNQLFNVGKIYKLPANMETLIVYQNYLYLFNKDSLKSNSLSNININKVLFNKYYPILNKDELSKATISISSNPENFDNTSNRFNLLEDNIGFYNKELTEYKDIVKNLQYFQSKGVKECSIINLSEKEIDCDLYIEFVTDFYENENFYIENSNNIELYQKYTKNILGKEYITFLFKYTYNLSPVDQYLLNHNKTNRSQIILGKDLINFSAKLII